MILEACSLIIRHQSVSLDEIHTFKTPSSACPNELTAMPALKSEYFLPWVSQTYDPFAMQNNQFGTGINAKKGSSGHFALLCLYIHVIKQFSIFGAGRCRPCSLACLTQKCES